MFNEDKITLSEEENLSICQLEVITVQISEIFKSLLYRSTCKNLAKREV